MAPVSVSPATPERPEHRLAELMGGRDRGGVERRERVAQPEPPKPDLGGVGGEQVGDHGMVSVGRRRVGECALGPDQLLAHPFAQLLARSPTERDHQELVERDALLGDVAGHQGGDGEGLAGAGARLEQGGAGRQRPGQVEGLHHQLPCSASKSGLHTRSDSAPNRPVSPGKSSPVPGRSDTSGGSTRRPQIVTAAGSDCSPGNFPSFQS